jgi:cellulose synthase/poly-beta-1,6-N-acetylglucosamine synthase-like glycosyltransferase
MDTSLPARPTSRGVSARRVGVRRLAVEVLALATEISLAAFSVRRVVLLLAALVRRAPNGGQLSELPSVTLITPARNEAAVLGRHLDSLALLDYPPERLSIVLVSNGSDDDTGACAARWAAGQPDTTVLNLDRDGSKGGALNAGIEAAPPSDLVIVCDADMRPRSDSVRRLAEAFADAGVGAAAAFLSPSNPEASAIARYTAVESWVHQLVTSAGKDRLSLNPPTLGGSAYRRAALDAVGRFPQGPGQDVKVTVDLTRAGWQTRFVPDAVFETEVASRWGDYWHQHIRWARSLFAAGKRRPGGTVGIGLHVRIETWILSTGYADRLAFLASVWLAATSRRSRRLPVVYLAVAAAEVVVALLKAGAARQLPRFFFSTAAFFGLDVAATLAATGAHVLRRPRSWRKPERASGLPTRRRVAQP